jgi:hypothetical protein
LRCAANPRPKLVRVAAEARVPMVFLQLVGIPTVTVAADTVSEAASVDLVLVIDASESQAYDQKSMRSYLNDPTSNLGCNRDDFGVIGQRYAEKENACIKACNDSGALGINPCHPFREVKDAAKAFIDQIIPASGPQGFDRIAVVGFDRTYHLWTTAGFTTNPVAAKDAIEAMRVADNGGAPCPYIFPVQTAPQHCTSSNLGGGLALASYLFSQSGAATYGYTFRDDSLWTVVILGSGGADASDPIGAVEPEASFGVCPALSAAPFCRDNNFATHHISTTAQYDAEDYAYDKVTFLGGKPLPNNQGGQGIVIFTIGLGKKVVCTTGNYNSTTGACQQPWDIAYQDQISGRPNGAELFLRYAADIGDDGEANDSSGCTAVPSGQECGNYYFAPNATGLTDIFLKIAGRIFTRLAG